MCVFLICMVKTTHPVYDDHSGNVPRVVIKVVRGILEVSKES